MTQAAILPLTLVFLLVVVVALLLSSFEVVEKIIGPFAITVLILATVSIVLFFAYLLIKSYCVRFVEENSCGLKALSRVNEKFVFSHIAPITFSSSYDNEAYYNQVSPIDYLTYQLMYQSKNTLQAIKDIENNAKIYPIYISAVNNITFGEFEKEPFKLLKKLVLIIEKRHFDNAIKRPLIEFKISVKLFLTNINGSCLNSNSKVFYKDEVLEIIKKLGQKLGDFYLDERIWDSICRVERAKVSNKMRFAVYRRDGNRCRYCGATSNLEVDHIFPIAKGGKTTFDNLQTLCARCNSQKSDKIILGAAMHAPKNVRICPKCNKGTLVLRQGQYGKFFGCTNYPECKYTEQQTENKKT